MWGYRVILDTDPRISGIFPVTNGKIDAATGPSFLDSEGLFFVETVPLYGYLKQNQESGYIRNQESGYSL